MRIYGFDKVFETFSQKNPSVRDAGHDIGKVRDKYTEILDAVGIDKRLLQAKEKVEGICGKMVKRGDYIFPEQSVEFCVIVIQKYTSRDFKKLRKADYDGMVIYWISFLIRGFRIMLCNLGYSEDVVLEQYHAMERRMAYKLRLALDTFECRQNEIQELAKKYEHSCISFNYCDKIYFLRYMASKIEETKHNIESVYKIYTDIRTDELSNMALEETYKESPQISAERMRKEMIFFNALEHDDEYQKLQRQQDKLIAEDTFVKNKQARFKKLQARLAEIRKKYQMELFGELLEEEEDVPLTVRHPRDVLEEAVKENEFRKEDFAQRSEIEAAKTPEDIEREKDEMEDVRKFLEEHGKFNFDLPNMDEQEEEILVQNSHFIRDVKGKIQLPCCCKGGEITAYKGIKGKCILRCPGCGRYVLIDYDKMAAEALSGYKSVYYIKK